MTIVHAEDFREAKVRLSTLLHADREAQSQGKSEPPEKKDKRRIEIENNRSIVISMIGSLTEGSIDPWLGTKIKRWVRKGSDYVVYLDEDSNILWWGARQIEENMSGIPVNIRRLVAASSFLIEANSDLYGYMASERTQQEQAKSAGLRIRELIAESIVMAFNRVSLKECEKTQAMAAEMIVLEKDQVCRRIFFGNSFWEF